MTDTTLSMRQSSPVRRLDTDSDAAQRRIRRRYAAERRFRAYGLAALGLTCVFLVILFADILRNGLPAFWQHSLVLDVPVKAEVVDPDGKRSAQAIRGADYFPVTRDALLAAIPGVEGRQAQRRLTGLLSTGAADELRNRLAADPSLIGQTVKTRLLLSDDADLYLKGVGARIVSRASIGTANPSGTKGEVTVLTSANDFRNELADIKRALGVKAAALRAEADRLARSGDAKQADRVKELRGEAAALQERADRSRGEEVLDDTLPSMLVAVSGGLVKATKLSDSAISGEVLLPLKSAAEVKPGDWQIVIYQTPQSNRKVTDQEVAFLERLKADGKVERHFNWLFFTSGDSREPELAGIRGAIIGSVLTLLVTLALCLPIGVLAAVYLEEFAPKNRVTEIIEVNINNLAAVPSIVFGLLGLAMFLNFFGLPRSAPLVGGLVLALLVLPTIIIASRAALKAVPPSIKEAALGVGASHQQAVFHHVLPLAMPGIMTGTIIGMAHALGETAPLLMIGMVAFIVDVPSTFTQAATVLPVQIYLWSDLPELAFQAKTAAAIIVLLCFLFVMNGLAIWLRRKFERRW
jgi:phosphate transport system permease protein